MEKINWRNYRYDTDEFGIRYINSTGFYIDLCGPFVALSKNENVDVDKGLKYLQMIMKLQPCTSRQIAALAVATALELFKK